MTLTARLGFLKEGPMPWQEESTMQLRRQLIQDVRSGATPLTELVAAYGISRKTGYKWLAPTRPAACRRSPISRAARRPPPRRRPRSWWPPCSRCDTITRRGGRASSCGFSASRCPMPPGPRAARSRCTCTAPGWSSRPVGSVARSLTDRA